LSRARRLRRNVRRNKIPPDRIIRRHGPIGLVGVQSSQFPRAVDVAPTFIKAGMPVSTGGFHVSGCAQPGLCESLLGEHNDRCEQTNHHDNGSHKKKVAQPIFGA